MDKSLGTNLHLWRFFSRYTSSAPPPTPPPPYNVGHVYMLFLQSFNIVLRGEGWEATHFETGNSALRFNSVLKAPKINAITQVSQGILSTIVDILFA